jgi:hypothetical protein
MKRIRCAFLRPAVWRGIGGLLVLFVFSGCGPGSAVRLPVTGTVTFKGTQLAHGTIAFSPVDEAAGTLEGAEIRDGQYVLPAKSGLMPGKYRVSISAADESQKTPPAEEAPGAGPVAKELIPAEYNVESKLTAEVTKQGPNNFNFDLK